MRLFLYIFCILIIFIAGMSFQTNRSTSKTMEPFESIEEDLLAWEEHPLESEAIHLQDAHQPLYTTTSLLEGFFHALFDKLVHLLYAIASLFFSG